MTVSLHSIYTRTIMYGSFQQLRFKKKQFRQVSRRAHLLVIDLHDVCSLYSFSLEHLILLKVPRYLSGTCFGAPFYVS